MVKFDGNVGKTLRNFAAKHADKIDEIEKIGEDPYFLYLKQGWRMGDDYRHTYVDDTVQGLIAWFNSNPPVRCDCSYCTEG